MPIRPNNCHRHPQPRNRLLALSLCLGLYAVTADAATLKGKVYPDEHKVLKAEESGFEVLQLTTNPADDSGLYFTSQSFVPDDNGLVFTSKRTGAWNLFYMNLKNFTFVQLTDSKKISGTGADVCAATHEVFYRDGQAVKAVNLKTLVERTLTTVPDGYSVGSAMSVTASGDALAFSISENIKLTTKTDKIYSDMDEHFAKRPWSAVWTGRADGTGLARDRPAEEVDQPHADQPDQPEPDPLLPRRTLEPGRAEDVAGELGRKQQPSAASRREARDRHRSRVLVRGRHPRRLSGSLSEGQAHDRRGGRS